MPTTITCAYTTPFPTHSMWSDQPVMTCGDPTSDQRDGLLRGKQRENDRSHVHVHSCHAAFVRGLLQLVNATNHKASMMQRRKTIEFGVMSLCNNKGPRTCKIVKTQRPKALAIR